MYASRYGTHLSYSWKRGNSHNPLRFGVNMGERLNTYTITQDDISNEGMVRRQFNSTKIHVTDMSFERIDGSSVQVIEHAPASETLYPAICSCGCEVEPTRITLLLMDGAVAYPAPCCDTIQFFEGDAKQ